MTCPICARTHPAPGAIETTAAQPCGRCWAALSPADKAPYLYALRTSPELGATFASRDPVRELPGENRRRLYEYVIYLEARASQNRSTE